MIPKDCKRLAEVDFPIAEVSRHAAREKSIRHGHPSTLHLWWARRPLAACRAMLLALLLPDPRDENCPAEFREEARRLLERVPGRVGSSDEDLRKALLKFIGDFANWDLSSDATYLEVSRGLVRAAHGEEPPLVVDPFAGGGSIPLEALRLGCETFASDLNPVACLILKVMLEDIPRHGPELAEEVRRVGAEIKKKAERDLAEFYPPDPDGARPIAYLWARTVRCESPNCGAEIPLVRSFWLCKKEKRRRALKHRVVRPRGEPPRVALEVFEPKTEKEVADGTVTRAKATCVCCAAVLPPDRVRAQLAAQHGGADVDFDAHTRRSGGARMLAVVTLRPGETGRHYRLPNERDYEAVRKAQARVVKILAEWERGGKQGLCPVPDEPTPAGGGSGAGRAFNVQRYGILQWGDLFTVRQKVALLALGHSLQETGGLARPLSLSLGKLADLANTICPWEPIAECPRNVLSNGRLKPGWDFAEGVPISDASGGFATCVENLASGIESVKGIMSTAQSEVAAAQASPLPSEAAAVWFTDPPYYDAIPYADLSDFFYVWYRRVVPEHVRADPFDPANALTPKRLEAVHDETRRVDGRAKDRAFFEDAMAESFSEGKRVTREDGVASVVFAHKTTEGWEALLSGITRGGWTITGSWPVATEQAHRLRARDSAALATSVHLICRPRPVDADVGDWAGVLRELPNRVGDWMERLQGEGVRGADLVFACIGPALEIYSRHSRVVDAEDREVPLGGDPEATEPYRRGYLAYVWEVVGRTALAQVLSAAEGRERNGAAGAVEEDARLTALFLWTLQSTNGGGAEDQMADDEEAEDADDQEEAAPAKRSGGLSLIHDVVRRFAQPLGIHLQDWEDRIIETDKGVVRLLPVAERAKQLFGDDGADAMADYLESNPAATPQLALFPDANSARPKVKGRGRRKAGPNAPDALFETRREATTLDRVHAAMLLQRAGRANALRALLSAEQDRGPDFLRLANALSALYPKESEEKRLLDAMLLAVAR
jgi:putative DNA methylase